jgi:hypothetical protein
MRIIEEYKETNGFRKVIECKGNSPRRTYKEIPKSNNQSIDYVVYTPLDLVITNLKACKSLLFLDLKDIFKTNEYDPISHGGCWKYVPIVECIKCKRWTKIEWPWNEVGDCTMNFDLLKLPDYPEWLNKQSSKDLIYNGNIIENKSCLISLNIKDLEPEFQKIINEDFWDMFQTEV